MRMLVHQSQAGCIIGKGGLKIKELREVSQRRSYAINAVQTRLPFGFTIVTFDFVPRPRHVTTNLTVPPTVSYAIPLLMRRGQPTTHLRVERFETCFRFRYFWTWALSIDISFALALIPALMIFWSPDYRNTESFNTQTTDD